MSIKNLKTGRKKAFNSWISSIIDDLNLRTNDYYHVSDLNSKLKPWHWKRLWQIFEEYIDTNYSKNKEKLTAWEDACDLGRSVILKAYGKSESDFRLQELMNHYLNSPNYD